MAVFNFSNRLRPQHWVVCILLGWTIGLGSGCEFGKSPDAPPVDSADEVRATNIPLRITVVGPISDAQLVKRQWQSESDQPIDIISKSIEEFVQAENCNSDVVLFPSMMIGDLVQRKWLAKLPDLNSGASKARQSATATSSPSEEASAASDRRESTVVAAVPKAWSDAARYDGVTYAIPLGCSVPIAIASDSLKARIGDQPQTWESLIGLLGENGRTALDASPTAAKVLAVDVLATCDRFLSVLFSITDRNVRYGILFDIKTMQARLMEPEFLRSAEVLQELANQPGGLESVVGSHAVAYRWAATHESDALAIASPSALDADARGIASGGFCRFDSGVLIDSGSGLLAALSMDCRQTRQSVEFIKWLGAARTRDFVAPLVLGVESASGGQVDSLAYRIRSELAPELASADLAREPRLPAAYRYRRELGSQLAAFLQGHQTAEQALSQASDAWRAIAAEDAQRDSETLRDEYQRSLGLTQ